MENIDIEVFEPVRYVEIAEVLPRKSGGIGKNEVVRHISIAL